MMREETMETMRFTPLNREKTQQYCQKAYRVTARQQWEHQPGNSTRSQQDRVEYDAQRLALKRGGC
jgi:hypothetical protein